MTPASGNLEEDRIALRRGHLERRMRNLEEAILDGTISKDRAWVLNKEVNVAEHRAVGYTPRDSCVAMFLPDKIRPASSLKAGKRLPSDNLCARPDRDRKRCDNNSSG